MIRRRAAGRVAAVLGVATCVAGIGLAWGVGAEAFTGTPAALGLVHRLEAQTARFPAVRDVPTGWVAYCPEIPFGWIDVPISGCREHARVTEEIDLSHGQVVRFVGEVKSTIAGFDSIGGKLTRVVPARPGPRLLAAVPDAVRQAVAGRLSRSR